MTDRNEWLQWRHKGLGASDVSALYNAHSHMTAFDLYLVKVEPTYEEKESGFAAQMGNDLEPIARARFSALFNLDHFSDETFEPSRVEMIGLPFMLASLDGASKDLKTLLEIKFMSRPSVDTLGKETPGRIKHIDVLNDKLPTTAQEGRCRVPYQYWIQIQHQLLVTGADVCHFISYEPPPIADAPAQMNSCEVFPDIPFMQKHLEKCCDFWLRVKDRNPPALVTDDYKNLRVKGSKALAQKYKQTQHDSAKKELMNLMTEDLMHIDGLFLNRLTNEIRSTP